MKTALLFAVVLTLIACQKNADLLKPVNAPYAAAAFHAFAPAIKGGTYFDGEEYLGIAKGEIVIALPKRPECWLETNVYSTVTICTAVAQ